MIVAEGKPIGTVAESIKGAKRVLVAGCAECVTVCQAGGEKEAKILAQALRLLGRSEGAGWQVDELTIQRQCEPEWAAEFATHAATYDAVVSIGCGVGVQFLAERLPAVRVVPGLDTKFGGGNVAPGVWEERCGFCGACVLDKTAGVCPIVCCAKSLQNGPCGGSSGGRCEVDAEIPCAWVEIHRRLDLQGRSGTLAEIALPKDWSKASKGPRRVTKGGAG